jgi:hypothetical protein
MNEFWTNIKTQLKPFEDKVFFMPSSELYLKKIEKNLEANFPQIYYEFLREFGFIQDFLTIVQQVGKCLEENLDVVNEVCPDYFPLGTYDETESIWLLKRNSDDNSIFEISMDAEVGEIPQNKNITFEELLNKSLNDLKKESPFRSLNESKIICCEFYIKTDDFNPIIDILNKKFLTTWIDRNWKNKCSPHIFEIEVALISIDGEQLILEREYDFDGELKYTFEFEESIMNIEKRNRIELIKNLLDLNKIEYDAIESGIIEVD